MKTDFTSALVKAWENLIQTDKTKTAKVLKKAYDNLLDQKNRQKVSLFVKTKHNEIKLTIANQRAFNTKIKEENEQLKIENTKLKEKIIELESDLESRQQ